MFVYFTFKILELKFLKALNRMKFIDRDFVYGGNNFDFFLRRVVFFAGSGNSYHDFDEEKIAFIYLDHLKEALKN